MRPTGRTVSRPLSWVLALLAAACVGDPTAPEPATISISPATAALQSLGETVQLTATVQDADGRNVTGVTVMWTSGDESVATVDARGLVTATGNGAVTVEASVEGVMGKAALTVRQRVANVMVSPDAWTLRALEATIGLSAEAADANGHPIEDAEITWSSDDESVVTVDAAGVATAIANGVATLEASAEGVVGSAEVTVEQQPAIVQVSPEMVTVLARGDTIRLSAAAADANGHPVEDVEFTWSSYDESVVTVDATGLLTAVERGEVGIAAVAGNVRGFATVRSDLHRGALLKFFEAMDGSGWENSQNWGTDAPIGDWHGVLGGFEAGVLFLVLGRNGLTGSIPPEIAGLETLTALSLFGDSIVGSIPAELGNLRHLGALWLFENRLVGAIPAELGNLNSLAYLVLEDNLLTGAIPPELGGLRNLRQLKLGENRLTGAMPPELGDLTLLESLDVSSNQLTGGVPPEYGNLKALKSLQVHNTGLSGRLPRELIGLRLELFTWDETDLCAPSDEEFQEWLKSIPATRGPNC